MSKFTDFRSDSSDSELPDVPSYSKMSLFDRIHAKTASTRVPELHQTYASVLSEPRGGPVSASLEEEPQDAKKKRARKSKNTEEKEAEKRKKQDERERKKKEKEQETIKKRLLQEVKKKSSLKECMKLITMVIDTGLMHYSLGAALVSSVQESQMQLDVTPQPVSNLISFTRQVTEVIDLPDGMVKAESHEELEDNLLLYMRADQFADMALVQLGRNSNPGLPSLKEHINQIQAVLGKNNLTVLVQGMDEYYRNAKIQKAKKKMNKDSIIESSDVHEVLVELLLLNGCNVNFLEKDPDVLESIMQYAKAVAEAPFKQDRLDTGLDFHLDPSSCVQIDKEAGGLARVWRQQLMVLNNVSTEVANAIAAVYPSPGHLVKAYEQCSPLEGQKLLQDIMVRRGYGVLETSRRVGKELSGRIYQLYMSADPSVLLVNNS